MNLSTFSVVAYSRFANARADGRYVRLGQCYFTALYEWKPLLAEEITATEVDPYYNDARIGDFLKHLIALGVFTEDSQESHESSTLV